METPLGRDDSSSIAQALRAAAAACCGTRGSLPVCAPSQPSLQHPLRTLSSATPACPGGLKKGPTKTRSGPLSDTTAYIRERRLLIQEKCEQRGQVEGNSGDLSEHRSKTSGKGSNHRAGRGAPVPWFQLLHPFTRPQLASLQLECRNPDAGILMLLSPTVLPAPLCCPGDTKPRCQQRESAAHSSSRYPLLPCPSTMARRCQAQASTSLEQSRCATS